MATLVVQILHFFSALWARLGLAGPRDEPSCATDADAQQPNPTDSGTHPAVAQRHAWAAMKGAPKAPRAPWLDEPTPPSWRPGMA
jgi:hypothetical protein